MNKKDMKTIQDFGEQWQCFTDNDGYYGSADCLQDIFGDMLSLSKVKNTRVADIGSGTGRIVNMLLDAGASFVLALEPSSAFDVLKKTVIDRKGSVELLKLPGNEIPQDRNLDFVVSIGVLHHIVAPESVVYSAYNALRPGGKMLVWLYGREGNRLYLFFITPFRMLTKRLPHRLLYRLCVVLNKFLSLYLLLCSIFPLPMKQYMFNHIKKLDNEQRIMTIYDQLNPAYAKYYSRKEAIKLLSEAGFEKVCIQHRHGYSWTVIGEKPINSPGSLPINQVKSSGNTEMEN